MEETIYGSVPSKSNCYKIITLRSKDGKSYSSLGKTSGLKKYEQSFYRQLSGKTRGRNIEGHFEFEVDVYYSSMRPDLDNSLKILLDCLQKARAIKNDNKCMKIIARKFIDKKEPRVEFKIIDIEG